MRINNTPISEYKATLLDRNISPNRVTNNYSWDYSLDRPSYFGNAVEFKDVQIWLKFECSTESEFHLQLAKVSEDFRKGATIKFDDLPHYYTMYLKQKAEYTKLNPTIYKVEFVLDSDYGLSEKKIVESATKTLRVNNVGIYSTPAILWLTVPTMQTAITITGFEHSIVINNTPNNAEICIDAINGILTINNENAMKKLQTFHLPKLSTGVSNITVDKDCSMTLEYYERY